LQTRSFATAGIVHVQPDDADICWGVSEVVASAAADMQLRSLTPFRQRLITDE